MVGDGEREGVARVRRRRFGEAERRANEQRDLALVGLSATRHRPLHPSRGVLGYADRGTREAQQDDTASVPELCRRLGILVKKQRLDGPDIRPVALDDLGEPALDRNEPLR